jgi:hypothetical protein
MLPSTGEVVMAVESAHSESCVAVLVDCDNAKPDILEFALRMVAHRSHPIWVLRS